ncbi:MAG TPA: amidohydrolase family protein, partial [Deinococcales bacterium]|nr:amidohydrolase family protein [Deinococcales bacterium]
SIETGLENVRLFHEAGVPILAGTDALNPGTAYGASMHEELRLLSEAGLSPAEALAAATSVPARTFSLEDQGVIEEGAVANLLLVNGDPTSDLLASRNIAGVWKHGEPVDREAWSAALAGQAEQAAAQAAELADLDSAVIGDFEAGDTSVPFGQPWLATTDEEAGGNSTAEIAVVEGGPGDSEWMLEVTGEVGTDFMLPWSGVMFMPGSTPFGPANLENIPELNFQARGTPGEYRVQLFCESNQQLPGEWEFDVEEDWQDYAVDLGTIGECDTGGVLNIIFSSGTPGEYTLQLDNISLEAVSDGN